jgi:xanthine dehydrogenase accessory factor
MNLDLCTQLVQLLESGEQLAFGVVVETRGSTPQKPGAEALFLRDGRIVGTLGGGCLEAESRRRALLSLDTGEPSLFELHLDEDFGWDDGLVCGGTARVFIQPLGSADLDLFQRLVGLRSERVPVAAAMVVQADCAEWVGRRCLLDGEQVFATELPAELCRCLHGNAGAALGHEGAHVRSLQLESQTVQVFLNPHLPRCTLLIAGAGHIGQALAHLGALTGFDVTVIDDRAEFANRARFPEAREVVVDDIESAVVRYPIDGETYVVIVTRGHRHDAVALRACLDSPAQYLGMIGSRRKIRLIFEQLVEGGYATPERLTEIHTPLGLDIGAVTVEEIAVSIIAEMIAVRRKGTADRVEAMRVSRGVTSGDAPK